MGLIFGRKGDAPPDIGKEEEYDETKGIEGEADKEAGAKLEKIKEGESVPQEIARETKPAAVTETTAGVSSPVALTGVQLESVNARIDSVVEWIKQFYDRFSYVSESIGEIRNTTMNNEKRISEEVKEANKVIDVVKEVKPEELRVSYQKADMKMTTLSEKIEANKLFMDEVMKEMNDLRRKSEIFVGTEGLMKLNNDTKKDLVEMQKINSRTRMQADKAQEIFMELRKGFAESQKVGAIVGNLDESYAGLKEAIEKLRLDHGNIVKREDYLDFKKTYGNRLGLFDDNISEVEKVKRDLSEMSNLVETSLSVSRRNEEDIGEISLKVGADGTKKVSDYENQMIEVVGIIETFSKQLSEVRKKVGLKVEVAKEKVAVAKEVVKPSDAAKEKVAAVKIAEVPKLKPEKFLVEKNVVMKEGEMELEKVEKKINKSEERIEKARVERAKKKKIKNAKALGKKVERDRKEEAEKAEKEREEEEKKAEEKREEEEKRKKKVEKKAREDREKKEKAREEKEKEEEVREEKEKKEKAKKKAEEKEKKEKEEKAEEKDDDDISKEPELPLPGKGLPELSSLKGSKKKSKKK